MPATVRVCETRGAHFYAACSDPQCTEHGPYRSRPYKFYGYAARAARRHLIRHHYTPGARVQ